MKYYIKEIPEGRKFKCQVWNDRDEVLTAKGLKWLSKNCASQCCTLIKSRVKAMELILIVDARQDGVCVYELTSGEARGVLNEVYDIRKKAIKRGITGGAIGAFAYVVLMLFVEVIGAIS